jgi:hypothetical protein
MKSILAVPGGDGGQTVYDTALLVARRFGSHVVGLGAGTTAPVVIPWGEMGVAVPVEADRVLEQEDRERREAARKAFEAFMRERGVPLGAAQPAAPGVTAEWREEQGQQNAVVGSLGRVFDLIVVERPDKLVSLAEATLEDALFESGRPVLMAPPKVPATLGEKVMIAWNGSSETARTIGFANPFLKQAKEIQGGDCRQRPPCRRPRSYHRRGVLRRGGRDEGRPDDQGRLHAESASPDDLRRRHPAHHHERRDARPLRPLRAGVGYSAAASPAGQATPVPPSPQ